MEAVAIGCSGLSAMHQPDQGESDKSMRILISKEEK